MSRGARVLPAQEREVEDQVRDALRAVLRVNDRWDIAKLQAELQSLDADPELLLLLQGFRNSAYHARQALGLETS